VNNKGMTPAPAMDTRSAPRKVESTIKAQKTKNLLKKHKERTSTMGAIVKLIEQGQGSSISMGTTMSMTLMHQMECINKSILSRTKKESNQNLLY
jgi:hypothetical protein